MTRKNLTLNLKNVNPKPREVRMCIISGVMSKTDSMDVGLRVWVCSLGFRDYGVQFRAYILQFRV